MVSPVGPVVGTDGALALPWLEAPLAQALATQRAHALLVHGAPGVGQFELALALAQAWLCEAVDAAATRRPCGRCAACKLVQARSHPDLLVLLPEALREPLGWSFAGADADAGEAEKGSGKRKPSREIRVDEIRQAIAFAQTSRARGQGKVVVLHPAEHMNGISANALLKTLEEPPGSARLVLSCADPDALLPTIRSRCQAVALPLPEPALAAAWLAGHGVGQPEVLLAAAGGQPQEALAWSADGLDARQWLALPAQLRRGDPAPIAGWPLARVIDTLQKLCHDTMRVAAGGSPRYFPREALPARVPLAALAPWARELQRLARNAEHPWNAALMVESLTQQARDVLSSPG